MVIDDNGRGLSTSGLGHGDSHHVGDFNPYVYGQEIVACNEDRPSNNYRDATTSKLYYRVTGSTDDGRQLPVISQTTILVHNSSLRTTAEALYLQ